MSVGEATLSSGSDLTRFYGDDRATDKASQDLTGLATEVDDGSRVDLIQDVLRILDLSDGELRWAAERAATSGSSLEEELVASGLADEEALASAIAAALNVAREPIEVGSTILRNRRGDLECGRRHLRGCGTGFRAKLYLSPPLERLEETARHVAEVSEFRSVLRITTRSDISKSYANFTQGERSDRARLSLAADLNRLSARDVLTPAQAALMAFTGVLLFQVWLSFPHFWFALHLACSFAALVLTAFRLAMIFDRRRSSIVDKRANVIEAVSENGFPVYSVLVALHREAAMAEPLARAMAELDWPRSRLEVFFVCEATDPETIEAVEKAIRNEPNFFVIATPRTDPTTKPKALNFALPLTRGEFLVLYDAEDRPHPAQLRAAFGAFRNGSPRLACVQAPLTIRNASNGWFEALFALEYAVLFKATLPWLAARGLPIPLGGTSNHFRRGALVSVGGWDSHNVAEDADLGLRLARNGFQVGTIDPPTSESATGNWIDWRNQRTRWIKGWMQSWLVHMRDPALLIRQLGWRNFLSFQLVFGGMIAASLLHVVFACHLIAVLFSQGGWGSQEMSFSWLACLDAANLVLAYAAFSILAIRVVDPAERSLLRRLPWLWFYWFLVSLAGMRAAKQLIRQPHHWEKTPHREMIPDAAAERL